MRRSCPARRRTSRSCAGAGATARRRVARPDGLPRARRSSRRDGAVITAPKRAIANRKGRSHRSVFDTSPQRGTRHSPGPAEGDLERRARRHDQEAPDLAAPARPSEQRPTAASDALRARRQSSSTTVGVSDAGVAGGRRRRRARRRQRKAEVPELRAHHVGDVEGQPAAARPRSAHRTARRRPARGIATPPGPSTRMPPNCAGPWPPKGRPAAPRPAAGGPMPGVRHRGLDLRVDLLAHPARRAATRAARCPPGELRAVRLVLDRGGSAGPARRRSSWPVVPIPAPPAHPPPRRPRRRLGAPDVACESLRTPKPSAWNSLGPQSVGSRGLTTASEIGQACAKRRLDPHNSSSKHREHASRSRGILAIRSAAGKSSHRYAAVVRAAASPPAATRPDRQAAPVARAPQRLDGKWPHPSHQKPSCSSSAAQHRRSRAGGVLIRRRPVARSGFTSPSSAHALWLSSAVPVEVHHRASPQASVSACRPCNTTRVPTA